MSFLNAYGIWILLGLIVVWFAVRRPSTSGHGHGGAGCGMGCGMSGHQEQHEEDPPFPEG